MVYLAVRKNSNFDSQMMKWAHLPGEGPATQEQATFPGSTPS